MLGSRAPDACCEMDPLFRGGKKEMASAGS